MTSPISIAEKLAKIAGAGGEVRMSRSLAQGVREMERQEKAAAAAKKRPA